MRVESLGFRTDLGIRRLAGSSIASRDGYLIVKTPANPDYWWGNFILLGRPLVAGQAREVRAIFADEFPGATHLAVGIDGREGEVGDADELAALRLTVEVSAVLTTERVHEPSPARGEAEFRSLASGDDWAQAVSLRMTVYAERDTPDQRRFVEQRVAEERELCQSGAAAWFGAFVEGRLVASLGVVRTEPGLARYQNVETLPDHRRRGFASRLLYVAGAYGNDVLGARTLVIAADPGYHAISIYRALGFADAERQVQLLRVPTAGASGSSSAQRDDV